MQISFPLHHHRRAPTKMTVLAARSLATTPPLESTTSTAAASARNSAAFATDPAPSLRPTRKTFQYFLALARPEAPAFLTALMAVAVGTGTTVIFPFAIGKCMDAMTLGSSQGISSKVGVGDAGEPNSAATAESALQATQAATDLSMNGREFIEASFGPGATSTWLLDIIPPDAAPLSVLSTGLVGVFVLGALATLVRNTTVHLAGERIAARLRKRVFAAVLHQRLAFFDCTRTGELMNRLSNDVTQVAKTLSEDTSYFLRNFAQGAGALGMMFYTSPQICAIMLGVIPPVALWGVFFGRKVRALSKQMVDELAQAGSIAEERISNVRTVRALGNDELEVRRYAHQVDNVFRVAKHKSLLQGIYYGVAMGSGNLGMVTVLYFGGQYVSEGLITVGDLSTMLLYSVYAGFSISALLSYYGDLMKAAGSAERIFDLMDTDMQARQGRAARETVAAVQIMGEGAVNSRMMTTPGLLPTVRGPLVFEQVFFAYPTRPDFPVFHNLDLEVRENETLALVGPSGSGKSSIAALVTRMYEPDNGHILLGPERLPLNQVPKKHLRKSISYVTQVRYRRKG
jgi:ABC-type multidrug transport system fused ATPase/permease subunit